jgi:hypothetical protein
MAIQRIQFRRGTTAQWASENPILAIGEPGIELRVDNSIAMKVGDGSTDWATLPYFYADEFITESELNAAVAALVDSAPSTLDTLNELATALGDDPSFATTITTSLGNKSDIGHTHAISEVVSLQDSLDEKSTASSTETLTNKTIDLVDNSLTGTAAEFNTALSDADFITTTDGTITTAGIIGDVTVDSGATANVGKIFVHNPASGTPTGATAGDIWIW